MAVIIGIMALFSNKDEVSTPIIHVNEPEGIEEVEELRDIPIPQISVSGNFPMGIEAVEEAWNRLYPYYYKYLGKPTDFQEEGVKIFYDENKSYKDVETLPSENTIYTGVIGPDYVAMPYEDKNNPTYFHMMHEFAHIFFQVDNKMIDYDFGQWIWEGHSLIGESFTRSELYNENLNIELYDLTVNVGWDGINGVKANKDKYNKEIVDWSATEALRILTEVMSYDSDFDYIKRVNEGILKLANERNNHIISIADYKNILNEVSRNRLIDGMKAGEWLFSQPVSNINGEIGNYVIIRPNKVFNSTEPISFGLGAFSRYIDENGVIKEVGFGNTEIVIQIFDVDNNIKFRSKAITKEDGTAIFTGPRSLGLSPGAYKVSVEMNIDSKTYHNHNFFTIIPYEAPSFNVVDDRVIIIPLNSQGTDLLQGDLDNISITGVESRAVISNMIILAVKPGANIEIQYNDSKYIISKPVGGRIIPLKLD